MFTAYRVAAGLAPDGDEVVGVGAHPPRLLVLVEAGAAPVLDRRAAARRQPRLHTTSVEDCMVRLSYLAVISTPDICV